MFKSPLLFAVVAAAIWWVTPSGFQPLLFGALVYGVLDAIEAPTRVLRELEKVRAVLGNDVGHGVAELETQYRLSATMNLLDERINVLRAVTGNYPDGHALDHRGDRFAKSTDVEALSERIFKLEP